jgi:hypothetical protein
VLGTGAYERLDTRGVAGIDDLVVLDGNGFDPRLVFIDRVDLPIGEHVARDAARRLAAADESRDGDCHG